MRQVDPGQPKAGHPGMKVVLAATALWCAGAPMFRSGAAELSQHHQPLSRVKTPTSQPPIDLLSDDMLDRYRAEPGCSGKLHDAVLTMLEVGDLAAIGARHVRAPDMLQKGQIAAAAYNRTAQVAADKGCPVVARTLWLTVIEQYVGSGYAAMWQRAQIGIDDLRAAGLAPAPSRQAGEPVR